MAWTAADRTHAAPDFAIGTAGHGDLSTHIMQEVDAICDRVLVLRHGKLALDARLDSLRQSRTLLLRADSTNESLTTYLKRMPQVATLQQQAEGGGRATLTPARQRRYGYRRQQYRPVRRESRCPAVPGAARGRGSKRCFTR